MPFQIVRQDITRMQVDAIVNPTNEHLRPDGGTDAQIHRAAGPGLTRATEAIGFLPTGSAVMTAGFHLPCRSVIHVAGPVWRGGASGEQAMLRACYQACLDTALREGVRSLAFPLLSAGTYGFPQDVALRIGTDTIRDFLFGHEMDIWLVVYDPAAFAISQKLYANIRSYLDTNMPAPQPSSVSFNALQERRRMWTEDAALPSEAPVAPEPFRKPKPDPAPSADVSLEQYLKNMDESYRDMLLRVIKERGMTDVDCYKLANIDRKLFNKIINLPDYHPKKTTILALAFALKMDEQEMQDFLQKAGFSLSRSTMFDLIIRYCLIQRIYDVFEINETLFAFGQPTLGSSL